MDRTKLTLSLGILAAIAFAAASWYVSGEAKTERDAARAETSGVRSRVGMVTGKARAVADAMERLANEVDEAMEEKEN